MAITLRDVANRCGLSPSTVSDVLNNRSRTWASEETRRRVFEAASTLGYRPHSAARALRTGKTYVVAFLYHRDWNAAPPTFDGAAEIMAAQLGEQGYELRLHVYPNQTQLMEGLDDMVRRQSCDAIVLFGREADVVEQGRFLEQHNIPFVVKGRHEQATPHWFQADYDHEGMMRSVVDHFAAHGHSRIAYMGYPISEVYQERLRNGFCEAIRERFGDYPPQDWLITVMPQAEVVVPATLEHWLSQPATERPTAIAIGAGDWEWTFIERTLAQHGYSIGHGPRQIAVAGQATYRIHLAFGEGLYFGDISHNSIALVLVQELLLPMLNGKQPENPIQRILPPLLPIHSQRLELPHSLHLRPTA